MSEITVLEPSENLPIIGQHERNARNAVTLWLQGFRSENTRRAYRRELEAFSAFTKHPEFEAGAAWLLSLTETDAHKAVDLYRAHKIERRNTKATVNRSMAALNSFVTSARRGGFTSLRLGARGEKADTYRDTKGPGLDGVRTMLAIAQHQPDRRKAARDTAIVLLAFGLGLRRAEIAALDIGDVDTAAKALMILGKGKADKRPVTLPDEVCSALEVWLTFRRSSDPAAPLFTSVSRSNADGRLTGDGIYKIIRDDLGDKAGIRARPHGIRHTAITAALDAFKGDFRRVRAFSRHSSLDIIRRYDDNNSDHGGQVAKTITAILGASNPKA
jgi:integrase/recombinase XerC